MTTTFVATRFIDSVSASFTNFQYEFNSDGSINFSNPIDPSVFVFYYDPLKTPPDIPIPVEFVVTFNDTAVSYVNSTAGVNVDLETNVNHGGFAEGDSLTNVFEVTGSAFDDVIRGSNASDYFDGLAFDDFVSQLDRTFIDWTGNNYRVINNPGDNVLNGGNGNDLLEGRGGADTLNGGPGFDFASYETSPQDNQTALSTGFNGVKVQLPGATQSAIAQGGDATGDTFSSIEGLVGSRFNDSLTGNEIDNVLAGGLGNNVLNGMGGTDTADYSTDHFFQSGDTADFVNVHLGINGASGSAQGFDLIFQGSGLPPKLVQVLSDTLISIENVTGTNGNDSIVGNEVANQLDGRDGNDTLDGGFGNDILIGGAGIDTASYLSHDASDPGLVTIALGHGTGAGSYTRSEIVSFNPVQFQTVETDTLLGIENITGSNNAETIIGNEQNNVLDGRGGNDILDGGFGNDTLIGGDGINTASYLSHDTSDPGPVTIALGLNGADGSYARSEVVSTLPLQFQTVETDVLRGIENITGSNNSETIIGNEQANVLDGRGGNDTIDGGLGNDTIIGGPGTDTVSYLSHDGLALLPSEQDVFQLGLNGADGFFSRTDVVSGTTQAVETDVLRSIENVTGSNASEFIVGNELDNVINGRGGNNELVGGGGNDTLLAGTGDNSYVFTAVNGVTNFGNDTISDTGGNDTIFIDANTQFSGLNVNNDLVLTLSGSTTGTIRILDQFSTHPVETLVSGNLSLTLATSMTGGNGSGIISGTDGNDVMDGKGGDDWLYGNGGNDQMLGGDGNDHLFGGAGNDHLDGGPGNDVLNGGPGNNWLIGGTGNDTFVFTPQVIAGQAKPDQGAGQNFVEDFTKGQDHIDLTAFHTTFADMIAPHGQEAGPVNLTTEGHDTVLTFEGGGSVRLSGVTGLTAHDFLL